MNFLFVHNPDWEFGDAQYHAATYGATLRTFRLFLTKAAFPKTNHAPHSSRGAFDTFTSHLGRGGAGRETIGRRAPRPQMPAAYDRSECITELRLRNDVAQRMKNGRTPSCVSELPFTHPRKTNQIGSFAEETDSSSQRSPDAEDAGKVEKNTIKMDDAANEITGYFESA